MTEPRGRFPAEQRVRKRSEFQEIQSKGRKVTTRSFVLLLYAREPGLARLGITASKRVGNAIARNRSKRLIREAFRATRDLWPGDVDLVVIVRRAPAALGDVVAEWSDVADVISRRTRAARRDRDERPSGAESGLASGSQKTQTRPEWRQKS